MAAQGRIAGPNAPEGKCAYLRNYTIPASWLHSALE
jgi:hypothetical protein